MHRRMFAAGLFALLLGACASTPDVSTDVSPTANFSNYRTYAWASSSMPAGMDPVLGQRVQQAVEAQLSAKGYTKASPGDMTVAFTMGAQEKTDISSYGYFGRGLDVYQYTQGTLVIDVFDTATRQPVWHGRAQQDISDNPDPSKIASAVAATMKSFPARGAAPAS